MSCRDSILEVCSFNNVVIEDESSLVTLGDDTMVENVASFVVLMVALCEKLAVMDELTTSVDETLDI